MEARGFTSSTCNAEINVSKVSGMCTIKGFIADNVVGGRIRYAAAAPADRRSSFSGSGLPFSNNAQAFDNTPNQGSLELQMGNAFEITLAGIPNSYYAGLGTVLIPPTVYIFYNNGSGEKIVSIQVTDSIPYRTLTYPSVRSGVEFYKGGFELPVRSQEQILVDGRYPERSHPDFWGLRPRQ